MTASTSILELARSRGVLRSRDVQAHVGGSYRVALSALSRQGKLIRVGRGLYALPDHDAAGHASLAAITIKYPNAVFCLLTALQIHALGTQSPHEVWIAIDNKARSPRLDYPPLRVARFSGEALVFGVMKISVDGVQIPVTSVAKTITDCFKYRNKVGLDVALEALRDAWRSKRVTMDELAEAARVCRVGNVMRPYLESLV
jgi:predicted transcriptional regulator of viral defense system